MFYLVLLYIAATIAGIFFFHGIPILNVALGFLIGALVAYRLGDETPPIASLRKVMTWGLVSAGITILVCWLELLGALVVIRLLGPGVALVDWFPLLPEPASENPDLFRAQLFATIVSPALQILTTVFGGVVFLLFTRRDPYSAD